CGGWRAAGGARVAAASGGPRGARLAVAGGQLAAHAWRLPAVVLEARGLRWLAGSWRRTRGGCPRWCSRRAACGGWRAAGGARVAAARGGARGARPAAAGGQL
ncbi:unnamed protein product, partial [Prorocentrum cordatum]